MYDGVFLFSSSFTSIELPDGLRKLGKRTFEGSEGCCKGLTSVVFPDSLDSIGPDQLMYQSSIEILKVPGRFSQTVIGNVLPVNEHGIVQYVTTYDNSRYTIDRSDPEKYVLVCAAER
jgi:hypothetical protein